MSVKEIERFKAGSADGRSFTLVIYQHYSDGPERVELQAEVRTSDGRHVNRKNDREFEILDAIEDVIKVTRI